MKRYIALIILITAIAISSCSTAKLSTTEVTTTEIDKLGVQQQPLLTDLDVKETKVSGVANGSSTAIAKLKQEAVAQALEKSNADILIEPTYSIETKSTKSTVTVTGFAANYKNFRKKTEADTIIYDLDNVNTPIVSNSNEELSNAKSTEEKAKKKNTGLIILVIWLGGAAIIGLVSSLL